MIDLRLPARSAWLHTLIFAVAAAGLSVAAGLVMFSAFMFYDDEGYVLLSLKNFAEHGGLYREVYTQYGPFPFVAYEALHALGLPFTHTAGRLVTLLAWSATAILCAVLAGRTTRSPAARLAVLAGVFAYLWIMASEPSHPGGLIVMLVASLAALGHRWIEREQLRAWGLLVGATTAALLLTKINIGVFVGFSAVAWLLLHHRHPGVRRWAPGLVGGGGVLLSLALMRPLLGTPWVQSYALVFGCAAVAVGWTGARSSAPRADWRTLGWGLAGAAAVAVPTLGVIFLRGTTPADLLDGILLGPLRQPANFSLRYLWPAGIRVLALGSLSGCLLATWLHRRGPAQVDGVVAALRLLAAAALAVNLARFPLISPDYLVFGCTLPCLWLFLWPLGGEGGAQHGARLWVGLLLLGQCLHVFPVPGSQIAWGSVLALPLAAIGAWEAGAWWQRRLAPAARVRALGRAAALGVAGLAIFLGWRFAQVAGRYREGSELGLAGAEVLRLPDRAAALFRILSLNAVAHGDMVFSLPGMFSFNLWTGLPTPTHANVTHWFSLLSTARQQAIQRELEAHPRACLIVQREHVNFLVKRGLGPAGALYDYLAANYEPVFTLDDFEFCVRRGRRVEPFMLAEELSRAEGATGEDSLLQTTVLLPPGRAVASVEIETAHGAPPLVLHRGNSRVETAPTTARGERREPAKPRPWPFALPGPATVSLYYNRAHLPRPAEGALIVFRDAAGGEVGLARLRK